MATILNKDLVRETTLMVGSNPLLVTIKSNQTVELKLKGVRGGDVLNIGLLELWEYLGGEDKSADDSGGLVSIKPSKPKKGDNKMVSLYDLRSHNAISNLTHGEVAKFDGIISDMIKNLDI